MQLKYFGSKAWLAPHMDRLLGDVAVLHSPFFGSGKLEYYLAARRPGLEVRGVDAFEPVEGKTRSSCAPCCAWWAGPHDLGPRPTRPTSRST